MTTPATTPATPSPGTPGTAGSGKRLPNGGLRRMVAQVLADRPGTELTPGDVTKLLGAKSAGAVGNALDKLAASGHAELVGTKPVKYRATATTADAAAATVAASASPASPRPATATTPAAKAPATAPKAVAGPVTRPNGLAYHPRALADVPDVEALRKCRDGGVPALLYGPPGTGKTSVVEAAFGEDLITVQGDGDTTVGDFVGEYTQNPDGTFTFVHGPLVRAMRAGQVLFIDDATLIAPTVLAVVYPAMDGRKEIIVKANGGESVRAERGFYIIAGHNPGVHGAVLTDALSSRFALQIEVTSDYTLAAELKIDPRAVRTARNLATRRDKGEIGWAPQLRELIAFQRICGLLGTEAAAANLVGIAPEDDREIVAEAVRANFGQRVTPLALGARV